MAEDVKSMTAASKDAKTITSKSVGIENNFVNANYGPVDKACGCGNANSHYDELQEIELPVDEAVSISEEGGRRESRIHHRQDSYTIKSDDDGGKRESRSTHHRQDSNTTNPAAPPRLLVVSNKTKNNVIMQAAALPNVTTVQYKYESVTLEALLATIAQQLGRKKVESIALAFNVSGVVLCISGKDDKVVSKESMGEDACVREFFNQLVSHHLDERCSSRRLDLLACGNVAQGASGAAIIQQLETLLDVPVGISKDLVGRDVWQGQPNEENTKIMCVSDLYFHVDRLRNWSRSSQQTLAGFEKIRTVGKGAYGTAVLYRKKDDDSLVILKEINLHDLSASERNMALNEVNVLAMMDHPNIISYYDSFEEDGTVVIEMEYADGGTLSQYLSEQNEPLEEREILSMFQQMVAAIKYVHQHNVLHRDLKTANIFLTKEGVVKIGDFGISKLMSTTNPAASTVLGTPYYISPEMCEGKSYKDKSDIWALGCILHEMACQQKTFDGSNLPAVVNKIMKGQFAPVKGSYTTELKDLIEGMLQQSPDDRPSAAQLWDHLPKLLLRYEDPQSDCEEDPLTSSDNAVGRKRRTRSVLYYFEMASMGLTPIRLPSRLKIRDVAVGYNFVVAVSNERMVYTWGEGGSGELGHGTHDNHSLPEVVQALKGKSIVRACCGDGFSIFASDNGIVMTCGDGSSGCLGHGDWASASKPRLIEALLSVDVRSIACGPHHVIAVGSEGDVYSWGKATDGCLGLGHDENQCVPAKVAVCDPVQSCYCGRDGSMLLTDVGSVLACGNNEYNKLGLNQRQGFLMAMKNIFNKTVSGEKMFTLVKTLVHHRVVSLSMGPHHTAVVVEPGHVYMMGRNSEAQLGMGNTKQFSAPIEVKLFQDKPAFRVRCGEYFSVAATSENDVLFWGTKVTSSASTEDVNSCRNGNTTTTNLCGSGDACLDTGHAVHDGGTDLTGGGTTACGAACGAARIASECEGASAGGGRRNPETGEGSPSKGSTCVSPVVGTVERDAFSDTTSNATAEKTAATVAAAAAATATAMAASSGFNPLSSNRLQSAGPGTAKESEKGGTEVILQPTGLIRMDSSGSRSTAGDTVTLSNIFCQGEHFFIQVETTAPPPKRKSRRKRCFRKRFNYERFEGSQKQTRMSASSREGGDEYSSEASELDSHSTLPLWLKQELADSEAVNDGNEADATSGEDSSAVASKSSMGSIQINVHLKQDEESRGKGTLDSSLSDCPKMTKEKSPTNSVEKVPKPKKSEPEKTIPHDNGIPVLPVDPLSSSSSSDAMTIALHAAKEEKASTSKKSLVGPAKRVIPTTPYRSKAGPAPSLKPQHRLRSQGKTRRCDSGKETASVGQRDSVELEKMQMELERLKVEKEEAELRLKRLEKDKDRERERIRQEAECKAQEHEVELKREIEHLRTELHEQSHQLHDNYNVVRSMQEQLAKVQTEQTRLRSQEHHPPPASPSQSVPSPPDTPNPAPKESRICVLQ